MNQNTKRSPSNLSNILLIGMTGCGKSTMGRALAKDLEQPWVDTDHLLEASEKKDLKELLQTLGPEGFISMEGRVLEEVQLEGHVISSGGSLVYSEGAMEHLQLTSFILFLNTPLVDLEKRLGNLEDRGTVRQPGQSLASLTAERLPLYRHYADLEVDTQGLNQKDLLLQLREKLKL